MLWFSRITAGRFATLPLAVTLLLVGSAPPSRAADGPVRFNHDIRPILSENCYQCHGPDEASRAAGLRLDTEAGATEFAIVPGDAEASELIARITSDDPFQRMPPPDSNRSLSPEQIDLLRRWVDQGASYNAHWSFVPPRRPDIPEVTDRSLERSGIRLGAIDRFVLAKLQQRELTPAPPADRETLLRRATFDLTGLPPTPEEIDAFLADTSPDAYARVLDRLLASERFGERMAAPWLDLARYSDTYGYQVDRDRRVWPWRDWLIGALNENMPYDRFLTEQLAGDLLPDATGDQILATAFNRLHPQKVEGGSVPEEFRVEYVSDRVQTFATGFLGLTFECCRCHNHKYDPFSQKEYFQLAAFFDNIDEAGLYSYFTNAVPTPTLSLPSDAQQRQQQQLAQRVEQAQRQFTETRAARQPTAERWTDAWAAGEAPLRWAEPIAAFDFHQPPSAPNRSVPGVVGRAVELTGDDGIATEVGNFRREQPFSVSLWIKTPDVKERAVVFHRSRAWTDAGSRGYQLLIEEGRLSWSLIHFWPGNAIRIRTRDLVPTNQWVHVTVTSDGSSDAGGLGLYLDGRPAEVEVVRNGLTRQITGGGGDQITIGQRFRDRGFTGGAVDQFQVYDVELSELEVRRLAAAPSGLAWLSGSAVPTAAQRTLLNAHYRQRIDPQLAERRGELENARRQSNALRDRIDQIMVMRELPEPRQTYLLGRGEYDQRLEPVEPGTPAALPPMPDAAPRNRLGLARWLTDPAHPLTARVAVNRLWQICFGRGLVRTPEDFGSQGEPPTHPELLDWLAVEFVESGWDVKRMMRRIMMSATYRRSSTHPDRQVVEADPENRLLARFPSYRLPAEMLRDQALAISGRLVDVIGGPPVKPYEIEASFKPSPHDTGENLYRRSLYTYWKRTGPAPAMMTLGAAKREVCRMRRERTSSPLQAFVLFNGPQYTEAARGLAERLVRRHGDDRQAILSGAFRTLTSRRASDAQLEVVEELFAQQLEYFRDRPARAEAYLAAGDAPVDATLEPVRTAALGAVISTLMNFDLCVMKR